MTPEMAAEMTPERWQRIKEIFEQAVELEPGARTAFLDAACAADGGLRREVETLLAADAADGSFIEAPAIEAVTDLFPAAPPEAVEGRRVGPYKLLREIGRGGMGAVYLAARADGQYQQRVALKLIARDFGPEEVVRRFRAERQILAALNHPHIARLLDGGASSDSRPYFVMEYIEGESLTAYCDRRRLSTAERLKLFRDVCAAVHYAHQNLVVHRDLKPSNILVTSDGAVKLLDFGIAKLLNPELSGLTIDPTGAGQRLMTPEYASPEQVQGLSVTTASDVYSLGVVLYELLTGHRPYRLKSRALKDVLRAVCEEEPERPSTAVSRVEVETTEDGAVRSSRTPESVSWTREGTTERLRRRLRGDLDNIVLKALCKEPGRRYASAEQFSEDLRRHLAGLPVIARGDSLAYRASKFVRRHKVGVAAAALLVVTLLGGIVATARQARIAERRFGEVRHLANTFLFEFDKSIERLPGATPARRLIVTTALEYLDRLAREASGDAALERELAAAYVKVGDLQGNPNFPNVGDLTGAEQSYRKSLALHEALAARAGHDLASRRDLAASYDRLGDVLYNRNELAEAEKLYRQALDIREAWAAAGNNDQESRADLAKAYNKLGLARFYQGDVAGARGLYEQGLPLGEALAAEFPADYTFQRALYLSHVNLGDSYTQQDDYGPALASFERARQIAERAVVSDAANAQARRDLALALSKLGETLSWAGRPEESLARHRAALDVRQQLALADPANRQARRDEAISHTLLGQSLAANGKLAEGQEEVRRAVTIFEELRRTNPANATASDDLLLSYNRLGRLLLETDPEAGLANLRRAFDLAEERAARDRNDTAPRRGVASTAQQLAESYARLAADKKAPAGQRLERLSRARQYFQRYLEISLDLKARGALSEAEANSVERVRGQLAACEAEMARLSAAGK
jgi:eukaryotic-like serine/threonine-protein kinase